MLKQLLIFIAVIAAVIAGYLIYQNRFSPEAAEPLSGNGISFICDGGDNFIAEFSPEMDRVNVIVAGSMERQLHSLGEDQVPFRFADDDFVYTFVGEEVVVADLKTNESYTCHQPFDPNNAPYNFGDGAEAVDNGEASPSSTAATGLIGSWQSMDDPKSVREFRSDWTAVDYYDSEEIGDSDWTVFTAEDGIITPFPQEDGVIYLRLADVDEHLYFKLNKITPEELELTYLDRGGVLRYKPVTPVSQ